jgi:hypothetical protein
MLRRYPAWQPAILLQCFGSLQKLARKRRPMARSTTTMSGHRSPAAHRHGGALHVAFAKSSIVSLRGSGQSSKVSKTVNSCVAFELRCECSPGVRFTTPPIAYGGRLVPVDMPIIQPMSLMCHLTDGFSDLTHLHISLYVLYRLQSFFSQRGASPIVGALRSSSGVAELNVVIHAIRHVW